MSAWPEESTATQKEELAHEIEVGVPDESMGVAGDQDAPFEVHSSPLALTAVQPDVETHETAVIWLDSGSPPLAPALAAAVSVQPATSPAMITTPASARMVRARVPTS